MNIKTKTILEHVSDILKKANTEFVASQIVAELHKRNILITKEQLNNILYTLNDREDIIKGKKIFSWIYNKKIIVNNNVKENIISEINDIKQKFELIGFSPYIVRRKKGGCYFIVHNEKDTKYVLIGPEGNIIEDYINLFDDPICLDYSKLNEKQFSVSIEKHLMQIDEDIRLRNMVAYNQIKETELYFNEAYIPDSFELFEEEKNNIPVDAFIFVSIISMNLEDNLILGCSSIFFPIYLVVNSIGLGLYDDKRIGVFKLCVYNLIKKDLIYFHNGWFNLKLKYSDGKLFIVGLKNNILELK